MTEPKQLTHFKLSLLHVWLYAPTALVGSVLMAQSLIQMHSLANSIPASLALFFITLLAMAKIKTLETKYEPAELLAKMNKLGGGLVLPMILKDGFAIFSSKRLDFWTLVALDLGIPILLAPYAILLPTKEKKKADKPAEARR